MWTVMAIATVAVVNHAQYHRRRTSVPKRNLEDFQVHETSNSWGLGGRRGAAKAPRLRRSEALRSFMQGRRYPIKSVDRSKAVLAILVQVLWKCSSRFCEPSVRLMFYFHMRTFNAITEVNT